MKFIYTLFLTLLIISGFNAQSEIVQTINYNSNTRDTIIDFPDRDHNEYERILMYYSMRCKDGLISTGSERNKGCGEWDYSCNTYIVDTTRMDSVKATALDYVISGFSGSEFAFTTQPTFSYSESTQYKVEYNTVITDNSYGVVSGDEDANSRFGSANSSIQLKYLLKAENLILKGMQAGNISGLSFNLSEGDLLLENLKVSIAHTESEDFESPFEETDLQNVYYYNTLLNSADTILRFYENYEWDGVRNLIVTISYDNASGTDLELQAGELGYTGGIMIDNTEEGYLDLGGSGYVVLDEGVGETSDQITVAFWQNGSESLPVNSTIFEAVDKQNQRSVNIHLPWGNGQVYWDCGNEGSSYDRINKPADPSAFKSSWNHWAFTKNASTGVMEVYLNGALWHSGTGHFRPIEINKIHVGTGVGNTSIPYLGKMDEVSVWNKALTQNEILEIMYLQIPADATDLMAYLSFDDYDNSGIIDNGQNANPVRIEGAVASRKWRSDEIKLSAELLDVLPEINLHQGTYFVWTEEETVRDSIENLFNKVDHYKVEGTDLVFDNTMYLYEAGTFPVINEEGVTVDEVTFQPEGTITPVELQYYNKTPMAFEIMSFVTPYGIGLDFGLDGHTWVFDVTDFGPILKGQKRMYLSRGGQWQEEMDIRFEFIEGVPDRDVIDINQIWPVQQTAFGSILNDWRYEPRNFTYDPNISAYVIKSAITGHGQQGEFIPRNHILRIGGFNETWQVWKECADNPVYPQGGTWVYDRAGWCPGAPTDIKVTDATDYFQFLQDVELDYTIQTATGDSRYIVNHKLIQYGPANKNLDLGMEAIMYPSDRIEFGRFNPNCTNPKIVIKNRGEERITSATIEYGVIGSSVHVFDWEGNLNFLDSEEVELDFINALSEQGNDRVFFAEIVSVNGRTDDYTSNDMLTSEFTAVPYFGNQLILEFRTNSVPQETSYRVFDSEGNLVHSRFGSGLTANRTYIDTLNNLNGCYQILVEDTDDDGISWWANNDGNGFLRIKEPGGSYRVIATDFGKFVDYQFSAGMITDTDDVFESQQTVNVFPNPGEGTFFIEGLDNWNESLRMTVNDIASNKLIDKVYNKIDLQSGINLGTQLGDGVYIIQLTDNERRVSLRLVVNR